MTDDDIVMPQGKYRGRLAKDVYAGYLIYLYNNYKELSKTWYSDESWYNVNLYVERNIERLIKEAKEKKRKKRRIRI